MPGRPVARHNREVPGEAAVPTVTVLEAHADAEALLLDVREPEEWAAGRAPTARHMPLGRLDPAALPAGRRVLCICRSGGRSAKATEVLRAAGFEAFNVAGGMQAWVAAGLTVTCDTGPGRVI